MVPHCNVNMQLGCEECRSANAYGTDCKRGLLFPVLALMAGCTRCPAFEAKTREQIEEQLKLRGYESKMA